MQSKRRKIIGPSHSGTNPSSVCNMNFCVGQPPPKLHLQWLFLQRHTCINDTIHNWDKILAFLFDPWVRFFDTQTIIFREWRADEIQIFNYNLLPLPRQRLDSRLAFTSKAENNRISYLPHNLPILCVCVPILLFVSYVLSTGSPPLLREVYVYTCAIQMAVICVAWQNRIISCLWYYEVT